MAVWYECGNGLVETKMAKSAQETDALLCCPGPSLKGVGDLRGPGRTVVAINAAYPTVKPDMWVGMDYPYWFNRTLFSEHFPKFMRGGYQGRILDGKPVALYPGTYFIDLEKAEVADIFRRRAHDVKFVWHGNTLATTLHLLVWMGFKRIFLVGSDLGGEYCDDRPVTDAFRAYNLRLYRQQAVFLKQFHDAAKGQVSLITCSPGPTRDILPCADLQEVMSNYPAADPRDLPARRADVVDNDKVAVITPTRGDRPEFMEMLKRMVEAQTKQPDTWVVVDRPPNGDYVDQRERVSEGVAEAVERGCSRVIIMEDDDYYPADYIERVLAAWGDEDMVGGYNQDLYHVVLGRYAEWTTDMTICAGASSPLHSTSFTVDCWNAFQNSGWMGKFRNLDQDIWAWAKRYDVVRNTRIAQVGVLSIKHGIGKPAGGNHVHDPWATRMVDADGSYLARRVPEPWLSFYRKFRQPSGHYQERAVRSGELKK